jgi:general secretion pathway protein J
LHAAPRGATRGFTLVELLVAISILALVAVLGWRGLDGITRARAALTQQLEATRGLQLAFAQMQSDCEHMASAELLQQRPPLAATADRMTLVRNVYAEGEPARLQVVSYQVRDGVLLRRESQGTRELTQLDVLWRAALSDSDASVAVPLQTGVLGMAVLVWDGSAWRQSTPDATGGANPQQPTPPPGMNAPNQSATPTGLQVALTLDRLPNPMSKSFLLGGM